MLAAIAASTGSGWARGASGAPEVAPAWLVSWASPMAWQYGVARDATVRELARLSIGGRSLRVRVSNAFGTAPVTFAAGSVGISAGGAALDPGSARPLRFSGAPGITLAAGQMAYSDPVQLTVVAGQTLDMSLFVAGVAPVSVHPCCQSPVRSYFTPNSGGDRVGEPSGAPFSLADGWVRWVDAVDVSGAQAGGAVVVMGDSIADGFNTPLRWTRVLNDRIQQLPPTDQVGVINEAITANTLTATAVNDSTTGGGPPGIERLGRDVLSQPGLRTVVVAEGTNDLYFGATGAQVISGMQQVIAAVHAAGVRVIGTTILPRSGSEAWIAPKEAYRRQVNAWIRTSGAFDGVIDLAHVTGDVYNGACSPQQMYPPFDSGDHLHPNPAGQTAMADAVQTSAFGIPDAPPAPPLASTRPTPGCPAPPVAGPSAATTTPSATPRDPPRPTTTASPVRRATGALLGAPTKPRWPGAAAVSLGAVVLAGAGALAARRARRRPGR